MTVSGLTRCCAAHRRRIEFQLFGDLVELNFQRVTRLRRSMSALWTARRLVGKRAQALKFVARHVIGDRLQRAGVERAGDAVAAISAAIEKRLEMHSGDRAVFLHAGLDVHQHRMAAAMAIENFFARERHLHRASGHHRKFANDDFVIERIALAAKAAAVWRGNDANVAGRQLQNFRQRAMNVVWRLRRTPERQLVVRIEVADRGVLLHRQVSVAFVEESVFANQIGLGETFFDVAKFQRDFLVNVSVVAVFVNARFVDQQWLLQSKRWYSAVHIRLR